MQDLTRAIRHGAALIARSLALVMLALAAGLAPGIAHASSGKSFSLVSLDTVATVNPDGSMDVVETVTYSFSGRFTVGIRTFDAPDEQIQSFAVTDEGGPLATDPPSSSISGEWEWFFRTPIEDATQTFTVSYRVVDAVDVGPDVAELYWQFIGDDHPGIGSMSVQVDVPGDPTPAEPDTPATDLDVLRAWGHGPSNGSVTLGRGVNAPDVVATVTAVPSATFVELRLAMPTADFTAPASGGARLPGILDEEGGFIDAMTEKPEPLADLASVMAPIAAVTGFLGVGLLWFGFGRERKPVEVMGEYWREPLDIPPAVALVNLNRGTVTQGQAIAATIIDMAQRGYLTIEAVHEERFGPDKDLHVFRWAGKQYGPDVRPFEQKVMEMVFYGQTEVSDDQITEWARANRSTAASRLNAMTGMLVKEHKQRGFDGPTQGLALGLLAGLCLLVGGSGVLALVWGAPIGWAAIIGAVVAGVTGLKVLANRSQAGVEAAAKANGLKKFLKDFSNLEDAPAGHLILWERFLVFAVAFGVSRELMQGLSTRLPGLLADPSFGVWYVGPRNRFDRLDDMGRVGNTISSSFTPPSKSGSGGGFSGGGGGGGGGGGFGAR